MIAIFFRIGGWIALLPLALSAYILADALIDPDGIRLRISGIDGVATITRKNYDWAGESNAGIKFVGYSFSDVNGERRSGFDLISRRLWREMKVGDVVRVRFLPQRSNRRYRTEEIESGRPRVSRAKWESTMVFFIIALAIAGVFFRRAYHMAKVRRLGRNAKAIIDSRKTIGPIQLLAFRFRVADDNEHTARILQMNQSRHVRLNQDDEIDIVYDPHSPDHAYWWGDFPTNSIR